MPVWQGTEENRGGEGNAIRLSQRLSKMLVLHKSTRACTRSVAEMMSGMIRECVTDQRDCGLVFNADFVHAIVSCPGRIDKRGGCCCTSVCAGLEAFLNKGRLRVGAGSTTASGLTKRKVIGTIENNRLLCLAWRCAFSYTVHRPRCRTPGQYSTAFKDSQQLSFGLYFPFSLSLLLPSLSTPLSLDPRPTSVGYPQYSY
jgi:hypothetical protein